MAEPFHQGWRKHDETKRKVQRMGGAQFRRRPEEQPNSEGFVTADVIAQQLNPHGFLLNQFRTDESVETMIIGFGYGGLAIRTEPRKPVLFIAPSGSGKSSDGIVPITLGTLGPVILVTLKDDTFVPTAMVRANVGPVLYFSCSGDPTPSGATEVRWSMIVGAEDWDLCVWMVDAAVAAVRPDRGAGQGESQFWSSRASDLLTPLTHYAAWFKKDMRWLVGVIRRGDITELQSIIDQLRRMGGDIAADMLTGIVNTPDRERGSIFTTAQHVLRPYKSESALRSAENPNLDLDSLVAGEPDAINPALETRSEEPAYQAMNNMGLYSSAGRGRYATLYLTASSIDLESNAPINAALLTAIRAKTIKRHQKDKREGRRRPPTTFLLDEMAFLAPLQNITEWTSIGGQGVQIVGCLQGLDQAISRWGDVVGKALPHHFQNVVVYPGIKEEHTLDLISKLAGTTRVPVWGWSERKGEFGVEYDRKVDFQTEPRMRVEEILEGRPGMVFLSPSGGKPGDWMFASSYYDKPPWPHLIVAAMEYFAETVPYDDDRIWLPTPELVRNDPEATRLNLCDPSGELARRYFAVVEAIHQKRVQANPNYMNQTRPGPQAETENSASDLSDDPLKPGDDDNDN